MITSKEPEQNPLRKASLRFLPLQVFIVSFITLSYETTLLRIFSISLWYHFAFMIISIAMLGVSISGTILYLLPGPTGIKKSKTSIKDMINLFYILLSISIFFSYLITNQIPFDPPRLAWEMIQLLYVVAYCLILCIPFFLSGLIIATVLRQAKESVGFYYGMDLLGAGCGTFSVFFFLTILPPENVLVVLSIITLFLSPLFSLKRIFLVSISLVTIMIIIFIYPSLIKPRISPYKPISLALKYPDAEHISSFNSPFSRIDLIKSPAVRYAPGLSLQYLEPLPQQIGITIDGDYITALASEMKETDLSFIKYLPSSIGFELSKKSNVLLIDPKGGLDVLTAEFYKFKKIYKVESDPTIIKTLNKIGADTYRENTWSGLARTWLQKGEIFFDLINISMLSGMPGGVFGFSEDYRFTVEAFNQYIKHLKPDGFLSVNLYIIPPPRTEFRLIDTIYESLETLNIKDIEKHIIAIRSWGTINIIAKKSPFVKKDIELMKSICNERGFDLLYYKGIEMQETDIFVQMSDNTYFEAFKRLMEKKEKKDFIDSYIFDIRARNDNHPFFLYYLKLKNIKEIYRSMGEKWQFFIQEGYMLPMLLIILLLLSLLIIFFPVTIKGTGPLRGIGIIPFFTYFAALGIGYMFIEVALIQKLIYPLEQPMISFAVVVSSIVISSATGSISINKFKILRKSYILAILSILVVIYGIFFQNIDETLAVLSTLSKVIMVFILIFPLGFLMGIPFASGLSLIIKRNESLVPWAWAINGSMSVLSPILCVTIALSTGYTNIFYLAGLLYFLAFCTQNRIK